MRVRLHERGSDRLQAPDVGANRARLSAVRGRLGAEVDSSSLAVIRMGVGVLIAWDVWREIRTGLLRADYIEPEYLFRWWLFEWVKPLPGDWLYVAWGVLGIGALCAAFGLFYRTAAAIQFLGISYWFLLEKSRYLNHRYLVCLLALLLLLMPAQAAFSLDARRKPWVASQTIPAWTVWLLRFQVGVPYFFAGLAKLNFDWLVRLEPLGTWLSRETDFPFLGDLFLEETFVRFLAYGSTVLDLFVPFLLLHRRTRTFGFGLALAFHFINSRLFNIGIFPSLMIVATTIFFDPDWPRQMAATIRHGTRRVRTALALSFLAGFLIGGFLPDEFAIVRAVIGGFGVAFLMFLLVPERLRRAPAIDADTRSSPWQRFAFRPSLAVFLAVWVAVQLLVPLRHLVIPGNTYWTEEGSRFAWHMLLKDSSGTVEFVITDPLSGRSVRVFPRDVLTPYQISKMSGNPDMILQFAHYLEEIYITEGGGDDFEVRVDALMAMNYRAPQRFIDPTVDLTRVSRPYIPPGDWILPLEPYR